MIRRVAITLALLSSAASAQTATGTSYTVKTFLKMNTNSQMASMPEQMAGMNTDWTGKVVRLGKYGRGRIDIVEGQSDDFAKGDYILIDSGASIAVHPRTKTFTSLTRDVAELKADMDSMKADLDKMKSELAALGQEMPDMKPKVKEAKIVTDSLGAGPKIDGKPTQHWRTTMSYSMDIGAGSAGGGALMHQTIIDMWFTDAPALAPLPAVIEAAQFDADTSLAELGAKFTIAGKKFPKDKFMPLTKLSSETTAIPAMTMKVDGSNAITDVKSAKIDVGLLVLPADYTEVMGEKMENMRAMMGKPARKPTKDHGAPFRTPPKLPQ